MNPCSARSRILPVWSVLGLLLVTSTGDAFAGRWRFFGGHRTNTHHARGEKKISPENVHQLQLKWVYQTTPDVPLDPTFPLTVGDVTVPPAYIGGVLYFPDWAGNFHAVRAEDGSSVWRRFFPVDYSRPGRFMFFSRNTPAVRGEKLIIGSQKHLVLPTCPVNAPSCAPNDGAVVAAINRRTGRLIWSTLVDAHPGAKITGSPSIIGDTAIVPVSSWEEELALSSSAAQFGGDPADPYPCCSFLGSVVALDVNTGAILWQTYFSPGDDVPAGILAPGELGFIGVAAYGGSPAIDVHRDQVYVATANNYVVPAKAYQCERSRRDPDTEAPPELPPGITCENLNDRVGNHVDSVLALDLETGAINWSYRPREHDTWTHSCTAPDFHLAFFPPVQGTDPAIPAGNFAACPELASPDYGFGQAPMLIRRVKMPNGKRRDVVGVGEKSGVFYALEPDTGELIWSTRVSPGGIIGGMQWGSATDGKVIYTASSNANNASRDKDNPFYTNPLDPFYPGFPGFGNDEAVFSGPGFGLELDGRSWTLVNPPADAIANADGISTFMEEGELKTITGFWSALDAATGEILWQRPLPTGGRAPVDEIPEMDPSGGALHGSVTLANGVLFGGGTFDGQGSMFAMDASDGTILFQHNAQFEGRNAGGVEASPTVVDGVVYWGTGASRGGVFSRPFLETVTGIPLTFGGVELRNNKVYAFELPE